MAWVARQGGGCDMLQVPAGPSCTPHPLTATRLVTLAATLLLLMSTSTCKGENMDG